MIRVTIVGSGPAAPQPDTPASGVLVESTATSVLFDCGSGVVARLRALRDPARLDGVVVGHLHADHAIDLAPLRYLYPWPGTAVGRPTVWLPPGGRAWLTGLAGIISERPTFFADAFDVREYADDEAFSIGDLTVRPAPLQHYVPARGMRIDDGSASIVYAGDTGPTERLVALAAGADLLIAEATLGSPSEDEPRRGHSTGPEAIGMGREAGVPRIVLTHYSSDRRPELTALAERTIDRRIEIARSGLRLDVRAHDAARIGELEASAEPASAEPASAAATRSRIDAAAGSSPRSDKAVRQ